MTIFTMRCLKKYLHLFERRVRLACTLWLALCCLPVGAAVELEELRPELSGGAVVLQASLKLELSPAVEDALLRGVALYFVAEADLVRERWYWRDKKISQVARHYRLAYQPLTRVWRLQVASEPLYGAGNTSRISQSFDSLKAALDVIRRQSGWRLAEPGVADADARHQVVYRFRLDMGQLPRAFQLGVSQQTDWHLQLQRAMRLPAEATP